jgi:hypothetical protein
MLRMKSGAGKLRRTPPRKVSICDLMVARTHFSSQWEQCGIFSSDKHCSKIATNAIREKDTKNKDHNRRSLLSNLTYHWLHQIASSAFFWDECNCINRCYQWISAANHLIREREKERERMEEKNLLTKECHIRTDADQKMFSSNRMNVSVRAQWKCMLVPSQHANH